MGGAHKHRPMRGKFSKTGILVHSKQAVKGGGEHWMFPLCTTVLKFKIFEFVRIDEMVAYSENYLLEISLAILIYRE